MQLKTNPFCPMTFSRKPSWKLPLLVIEISRNAVQNPFLRSNAMKCPFCGYLEDKVVDSRESREGEAIRRRRECLRCERRFTSYERIDEIPYMVVKKDGRREP